MKDYAVLMLTVFVLTALIGLYLSSSQTVAAAILCPSGQNLQYVISTEGIAFLECMTQQGVTVRSGPTNTTRLIMRGGVPTDYSFGFKMTGPARFKS